MENEVTVANQNQPARYDNSPLGMLQMATANGIDIEKMERMLELQIKWEENEARKAFHKAMAAFKANPPEIEKDKRVGYESKRTGGNTSYSHASLHNVCDKICKAMSPHGLSAAWNTDQGDKGMISVTCTITHEMGHSESTTLSASPDNSGNKNNIQAVGSTITYLERYTLLALTGLATKDQDDDGVNSETIEYVAGKDLAHIISLHKKAYRGDAKNPQFWKLAGTDSWETIPIKNHMKILNVLNERVSNIGHKKVSDREPGSDDE